MKAVVVHPQDPNERAWANQFAGLDSFVKGQFNAVNWGDRVSKVFFHALSWSSIVQTVSDAARAAGQDGVVIIASGHGAAAGLLNWDATDPHGAFRRWVAGDIGKGLFWEDTVSRYTDPIPNALSNPTFKAEDEDKIKQRVKDWDVLQKRHDAFEALEKIGRALSTNKVKRLTFTVCNAGQARTFMDRIAKHCHCEVACFKKTTVAIDDGTFGYNPAKARLVFFTDSNTNGQGTNTPDARVYSPNLDDSTIAYVAPP
jgi:hypothetical protein